MISLSYLRGRHKPYQPSRQYLLRLIRASLQHQHAMVQLSVSIVDCEQSQALNNSYRGKNKPTNVISLEYPESREQYNLLCGELFLCDEVIVTEAQNQNKTIADHYSHMIIHGLLHLRGFDHIKDNDAVIMENIEISLLEQFGIKNPYLENITNEVI